MMRGYPRVVSAVVLALVAWPMPALAQSAANVAVVINDDSPDSQQIGEYYVRSRGIPAQNVIRIKAPLADSVTRVVFGTTIETPIATALRRGALQDRIHYIVLTKGVPLRVEGTEGLDGTVASVDSELTLLYRRMTGRDVPVRGHVPNPYFHSGPSISGAAGFTHREHDIYLVTRLDGFTVADVIALIDRAKSPAATGRIVLDQRGGVLTNPAGDTWLAEAGRRLGQLGWSDRVDLDRTRNASPAVDVVLGYYSWASNDPQHRSRQVGMRFSPGALAATFVSGDARTFQEPPAGWTPSTDWQNKGSWFAGGPQSLTGDLIREGVTGVAGQVAEPYLQSSVRPEVLFPAYVSGMNLAEAFYLAIPHLSWQTVVIGDPLCRPFERAALTAAELEDPVDPEIELPAVFGERRLATLQAASQGVPADVVSLLLLAESRQGREDTAGARQALEKATEIAPTVPGPHLQLAMLYEQLEEYPLAQQRYERVLELQPANVIALNNLAYALAVRAGIPSQAKPLAEKAVALAPRDPTIADTLAWVEHLLGNDHVAARLIAFAAKGAPQNAEVRLHAAFIYAAASTSTEAALNELKAALALNPELAKRSEVQELEQRLSKPSRTSPRGPGSDVSSTERVR